MLISIRQIKSENTNDAVRHETFENVAVEETESSFRCLELPTGRAHVSLQVNFE